VSPRVLVVDHRDSFVFNLVEDLRRLGAEVEVVRSDASLADVRARLERTRADLVLLSPGPGTPEDSGVMLPLLAAAPEVAFLGICLGLQAMVVAAGGVVGRAPELVHGRATRVAHDGDPLFDGVASPFPAGRYHSLCALRVPPELRVVARTDGGPGAAIPMAVRHATLPRIGLQFHPESILSPSGPAILRNALELLVGPRGASAAPPAGARP